MRANQLAICKRPCSNCPFRKDGVGIELRPGQLEGIVSGLLADDRQTFVCHKTLQTGRMTCAGAVGLMSKLGRLPMIARLGLAVGVITEQDIEASSAMVVDAREMALPKTGPEKIKREKRNVSLSKCMGR